MGYNNRIAWIDLCKCIGILFVILGHCPLSPSYIFPFYAFHIPLFFILAGYTLNVNRSGKEYTIKKFKSLIIPYFVFSLICLIYDYSMGIITGDNISLKAELMKTFFQQRYNHLWFLLVLFFSDLIVFIIGKMRLLSTFLAAIISLCAAAAFAWFFVDRYSTILYWNLDLVPIALIFVLIGFIYKKYIEPKVSESSWWFILSICTLATVSIVSNYLNFSVVDMFKSQYGHLGLFFTGAILGSYSIILIVKLPPPMLCTNNHRKDVSLYR